MNYVKISKVIEIHYEKVENNNVDIQFEDLSRTNLNKTIGDIIWRWIYFHIFSNKARQSHIKKKFKPGGLYIEFCFNEKETFDLNDLFWCINDWRVKSIDK